MKKLLLISVIGLLTHVPYWVTIPSDDGMVKISRSHLDEYKRLKYRYLTQKIDYLEKELDNEKYATHRGIRLQLDALYKQRITLQ